MFNAHLSLFWLFISTSVSKLYGMLEEGGKREGHGPSVQLRQPTSISCHVTIQSQYYTVALTLDIVDWGGLVCNQTSLGEF